MGRAFFERARGGAAVKPLGLVQGGAPAGGQRAAASHPGSRASDDRVFDGMCRQAGITRAATIDSCRYGQPLSDYRLALKNSTIQRNDLLSRSLECELTQYPLSGCGP